MRKFWFIHDIERFLLEHGFSTGAAGLVAFLIACLLLAATVRLLDYAGNKLVLKVIHARVKRTATLWDDFLAERGFFRRFLRLLFAILILVFTGVIFQGFGPRILRTARIVMDCLVMILSMLVLFSAIDAAQDVYRTKPQARRKSITGYVQVIKIVLWMILVILVVSRLIGKDPAGLLAGLAASAAVLSLVFRDTLLGFVASIQLSAQDMVRLGDWIEMPAKGADGTVIEMNVNSVKVRNWDNSVTMVPIYSMVSESFTNWRGMEESGGRRFRRTYLLDVSTVRFLTAGEAKALKTHPAVAPFFDRMTAAEPELTEDAVPNIGFFRVYLDAYIRAHKDINPNLMLVVRYLPQTENGITLEIYAFSAEKNFVPYENLLSRIHEHILAVMPVFGLKLYQRPSVNASAGYPR